MKEKENIDVILAGSGALYPVYIGALFQISKYYNISRICANSGGSIAGSIFTLSNVEISESSLKNVIVETLPINTKSVKYSIWNFVKNFGFVNSEKLEKTFQDLFFPQLKDSKIPIFIYACDVKRNKDVVFSSVDTPEMSVSKAIMASCAIPFVFQPTNIDGELYVDGGWTKFVPLDIFSDSKNVIVLRIKQLKESTISNNLIDYIQNVLYSKVDRNYKKDKLPDNVKILELTSKFSRNNLATTSEESAIDMFYEGISQVQTWKNEKNENEL